MLARTLANQTIDLIGQTVLLKGWVNATRRHGKIIFIDLRDRSGLVQVVFIDNLVEAADQLRPEFVVEIQGVVQKRDPKYLNSNLATGTVEVQASQLTILNPSEVPPIPIDTDGYEIDEEQRTQYRYLDLRRPRMQKIIRQRSQIANFIRQYLLRQDFVEIETPYLSKATPEGARDFLVPSRLNPGKFYALPQSPQQYKQLLMVAGFERYMQLPRCFRDEDPRADRAYGEFTQVDLELSFTNREEILGLIEPMLIELIQTILPEKKIQEIPFPSLKYQQAMQQYQTDRPDLRKDPNDPNLLAFVWIIDFPAFEYKSGDKRWGAMHHPFTAPVPEDIPLIQQGKLEDVRANQYDLALNGLEVAGGSIRITDPVLQTQIFQTLGHSKEEIQTKFGHLLKSFQYGVPPHGGIAIGFDRLVATLLGEKSVREAIAFPATGGGITAVMQAPSAVDTEQLQELHIRVE